MAEAIKARVKRERLRRVLDGLEGIYVNTPFEMDADTAYRWVREQREDPERDESP